MKRIYSVTFCAGAIAHFIGTFAMMIWCFSLGMARFDLGTPPSALECIVSAAFNVLTFPVVWLHLKLETPAMPGYASFIPWLLNSILWGCLCVGAVALLERRTRGRDALALDSRG